MLEGFGRVREVLEALEQLKMLEKFWRGPGDVGEVLEGV